MNLLTPDTGTIFWTAVTFLALLWVLKKLAWAPLVSALDERENRIRESLEKAEQSRAEAEQALAKYQEMLENARQESQELIAKGKKTAESMREELIQKARAEAEALLERAKREISLEREKAVDELKKLAVDLSLAATEKAIGKALTPKDHEMLVKQALKDMGETS